MDSRTPLREIVEKVIAEINQDGLDTLDEKHIGNLIAFRGLDLAAALNRFRDLIRPGRVKISVCSDYYEVPTQYGRP